MLPVLSFRVIFSLKAKILFEENTRKNIGISIFPQLLFDCKIFARAYLRRLNII